MYTPLSHAYALIPPITAILLAISTRRILLSLLLAIFLAGAIYRQSAVAGLFQSIDWTVSAILDEFNARIFLFDYLIGVLICLLYLSGSLDAIERWIRENIRGKRKIYTLTVIMGLLIFFDDYTSIVIHGSMLSRVYAIQGLLPEKLAYFVDSLSSSVATLSLASTWAGFELGLIKDSIEKPVQVWLESLRYAFYPILTIFITAIVAASLRENKVMNAIREKEIERDRVIIERSELPKAVGGASPIFFIATVAIFIISILIAINFLSCGSSFTEKVINADISKILLYSTFITVLFEIVWLLLVEKIPYGEIEAAIVSGFKLMTYVNILMLLIWTLKISTEALGIKEFARESIFVTISPSFYPFLAFMLAVLISCTTGSSWLTMGCLIPAALEVVLAVRPEIAPIVIGAIISGAIVGDHLMLISDTTVLSSAFSESGLVSHTVTQMPYGTIAFSVSLLLYSLIACGITSLPVLYGVGIAATIISFFRTTVKEQ